MVKQLVVLNETLLSFSIAICVNGLCGKGLAEWGGFLKGKGKPLAPVVSFRMESVGTTYHITVHAVNNIPSTLLWTRLVDLVLGHITRSQTRS